MNLKLILTLALSAMLLAPFALYLPQSAQAAELIPIELRCQELLVKVELQTDEQVIRDTLFQTLAVDLPVLFDTRSNQLLVWALMKHFHHTSDQNQWQTRAEHTRALAEKLRSSDASYDAVLKEVAVDFWQMLQHEINYAPLQFFEAFPNIPREMHLDIKLVFRTIDSNETLKEAFFKLTVQSALNFDKWAKNAKFEQGKKTNHSAVIAAFRKASGSKAVATSLTGKFQTSPGASSLNLNALNESLSKRIPKNTELTVESLAYFDQDLRKNIQTLSAGSITRSDYFREHSLWISLYSKSSSWLLIKNRSVEHKTEFLVALNQAMEIVDGYRRNIELEQHALKLAEINAAERIGFLQSNSESFLPDASDPLHAHLTASVDRALDRLKMIEKDLQSIRLTFERNEHVISEAQQTLRGISELASPAKEIQEIAEPLRKSLEKFATELSLDPVLAKSLTKTTWGFW